MKTNLVWYDLETTGLNADVHGVVQIAMLFEKKGEAVDKYITKVNCDTYNRDVGIDPKALQINGNTVEEILTYPSLDVVLKEIDVKLKKHYGSHKVKLAGFNNTSFDKFFLTNMYEAGGRDIDQYYHYKQIDIFEAVKWLQYQELIPKTFNQKLVTLLEEFKLATVDELQEYAHDALWDIEMTKRLSEHLDGLVRGV